MDVIYRVPIWLQVAILIGIVAIANEIGFRIGRANSEPSDRAYGVSGSLKGSIFGLVALLLAFTYAMTSSRFTARQRLVLDEANAIGTCYLRADILDESAKTRIQSALRRFTDYRLEYFDQSYDPNIVKKTTKGMNQELNDLWRAVAELARQDHELARTSQIVPAANAVIDLSSTRAWASNNQTPPIVLLLLAVCLIVSSGLTGHSSGQVNRRHLGLWIALNCLLTLVLFVMLDFDRPHKGLIHVNHQPLRDTRASMDP